MIVKYNNDLNYMPLPNFTGRQYDLFFAIISQIKDKHDNTPALKRFFDPEKRQLVIPYKKFVDICRIDEWNRSFTEIYKETTDFLDKLLEYKISFETPKSYYAFVCFEEAEHDHFLQEIRITFQKRFYDMVVNYSLGFTRFELAEFISLNSKYTKTLYRLLKQYRHTGYMRMEWEEFARIVDIHYTRQIDIDQRILKPAIAELTKPRNLFDTERVPFRNLQYKKLKKGGNKVVAIEFRFDTENNNSLQQNTYFSEEYQADIQRARDNYLDNGSEWLFINRVSFVDNKILVNLYDSDLNKYFDQKYTQEEFEVDFKPFVVDGARNKIF